VTFERSIGVSNYGVHHIKELLESNPRIKPSVNQVDLHPFMRRKDIEEICRKEDIALEVQFLVSIEVPRFETQDMQNQGLGTSRKRSQVQPSRNPSNRSVA
jgi:hypothetical protein